MPSNNRQVLIKQLQKVRKSKIICHITSDRRSIGGVELPALKTQIAGEAHPFFYEHLQQMGECERLDLFLYTQGGAVDGVWPLVNLFREHTKYFSVLVPFYAHSAGTLICLGADEIVMGKLAQLSPVDPTTANMFNPIDEKSQQRKPISVEDVMAYLNLAKEKFGINSEENKLTIFTKLSDKIEPLALGNVFRIYSHIRSLIRKLLSLHLPSDEINEAIIEKIVTTLTEELHTHSYAICRCEAQEIFGGKMVKCASNEEEKLMWALWSDYEEELQLKTPFSLAREVEEERDLIITGAFIESEALLHLYQAEHHITPVSQIPSNIQIQIPPDQAKRAIKLPGFPIRHNIETKSIGWKVIKED